MTRVLLLSNGHGEDLSGAHLACELQARGLTVEALPLVGHGRAYRQAGIAVLGTTREFSTGGLGYTSLAGRLTELLQGQPLYVIRRLLPFWFGRRRYRLVVAVGDLLPVLAAWLSGLPAAVYLVAYSSHYEGRLRLPWPCGWLLRSRRMRLVWSRDDLTAEDLSRQLGRPVRFLGNPFLDPVLPAVPAAAPQNGPPRLALLPGSRLPEALHNVELMLRMLSCLPAELRQPGALGLQAALVGAIESEEIGRRAAGLGWRLESASVESSGAADGDRRERLLVREGLRLRLRWGRFSDVLNDCDLVLSMTGTAAEQAVGLGLPVLQLAGRGPQFTTGFAEAQRRLLGPGLFCAPGTAGARATLQATADLTARLLARLARPEEARRWRAELARIGEQRIGTAGGSRRMAAAIMELIQPRPSPADAGPAAR